MNTDETENAADHPAETEATAPNTDQARELMKCVRGEEAPRYCGAKTRGGGKCKKAPLEGRTRCKLHGGASLRGPESKTFKHGLYSKAVPKNLKTNFTNLLSDPNLLEGRAEVALMQLRLTQLSGRVQSNESGRAWAQLKALFTRFKAANEEENQEGMLAALNEMSLLVDGEVNDEAAWEELSEFVEKATRIAEREWKRVLANRQVISIEQVHAIAAALIAAVNANVKDTQTRLAIAEHFRRLNVVNVQPLERSGPDADVGEPIG